MSHPSFKGKIGEIHTDVRTKLFGLATFLKKSEGKDDDKPFESLGRDHLKWREDDVICYGMWGVSEMSQFLLDFCEQQKIPIHGDDEKRVLNVVLRGFAGKYLCA